MAPETSPPSVRSSSAAPGTDARTAELLAVVAHEIRDPMTSTIGFAEMLLQKGDRMTPEERDEAIRTIAKTGRRLVALVEDLLEMAKLESGDITLVLRPTDLNDVVSAVLEERRPFGEAVEIAFDPGEDATVLADADRIHQVVTNLVSNAQKFSVSGEPVRIAIRSGPGEVVLAVQDRGIGIAPEDQARLFEPFARVMQPGVAEPIRGTGLGLHISKMIVDAHRGRIWVESEPGAGSTFFVSLPAATPAR